MAKVTKRIFETLFFDKETKIMLLVKIFLLDEMTRTTRYT
jgi:hypothetical protein